MAQEDSVTDAANIGIDVIVFIASGLLTMIIFRLLRGRLYGEGSGRSRGDGMNNRNTVIDNSTSKFIIGSSHHNSNGRAAQFDDEDFEENSTSSFF